MPNCLNDFNEQDFLTSFWQQRHLLLKQALPNYQSPLEPNDLAGLALEPVAESRIIVETQDNNWQVQHGPFSEDHFDNISAKNWTLLVQAVDFWLDDIAQLKSYFRFIPDWRIDDIMVSFAPTGGSVGPHFDQYDVFLLQASGKRRWKIGQDCDSNTPLQQQEQIQLLQQFDTQQEYLLEAGDILYVPPGCAHWGISESDDCMTFSIGFRAPSAQELILHSAEQATSNLTESLRFNHHALRGNHHASEISNDDLANMRELLLEHLLSEKNLAESLGTMMTEPKYAIDGDCFEIPKECEVLYKRPDARLAYFKTDKSILLFANGQKINCELEQLAFIQKLCDSGELNCKDIAPQQHALLNKLFQYQCFEAE